MDHLVRVRVWDGGREDRRSVKISHLLKAPPPLLHDLAYLFRDLMDHGGAPGDRKEDVAPAVGDVSDNRLVEQEPVEALIHDGGISDSILAAPDEEEVASLYRLLTGRDTVVDLVWNPNDVTGLVLDLQSANV